MQLTTREKAIGRSEISCAPLNITARCQCSNCKLLLSTTLLVLRMCSHHGSDGKEVGMVAALLKVHHDVEQRDLISSTLGVQSLKVLGQNQLVVFPVLSKQ